MAGESAFQVEGLVVETLPNGTYRAQLSNGHIVVAFVVGKAKRTFAGLQSGDRVMLQLSPYDLSEGRILTENALKR